MANKNRGEVAVAHDGAAYVLRYDVNALCNLEDAFGKSIGEVIADIDSENVSMKTVRTIFAAGLSPSVDEVKAGEIMQAHGVAEICAMIGQAFAAAFPESEGAANPQKATAA